MNTTEKTTETGADPAAFPVMKYSITGGPTKSQERKIECNSIMEAINGHGIFSIKEREGVGFIIEDGEGYNSIDLTPGELKALGNELMEIAGAWGRIRVGDIVTFGLGAEFEVVEVNPPDFSQDECHTLLTTKLTKLGKLNHGSTLPQHRWELGDLDYTTESRRDKLRTNPTQQK